MKTTKSPAILCLSMVALTLAASDAWAANFTTGTATATKFGVHEITLTGNGGVAEPYDTNANVTFTAPSSAQKTIRMFWDGGNTWRARCYVSETGAWTWSSSCATDSGLNNQNGSFSATGSSLRGIIKSHPSNPRILVTDDGKWFQCIGDTGYYMFTPGHNYQNYVRDDWIYGINFIRSNYMGELRTWGLYFEGDWGRPDLANLQA